MTRYRTPGRHPATKLTSGTLVACVDGSTFTIEHVERVGRQVAITTNTRTFTVPATLHLIAALPDRAINMRPDLERLNHDQT